MLDESLYDHLIYGDHLYSDIIITMTINHLRFTSFGIVSAADRHVITLIPSSNEIINVSRRTKIFKIKKIRAVISYFGTAKLPSGEWTDEYLTRYVNGNKNTSIKKFAGKLKDDIEAIFNGSSEPPVLGFHIAGMEKLSNATIPVMWYLRNIYQSEGGVYSDFRNTFLLSEEAGKHAAHAIKQYNWPNDISINNALKRGLTLYFQNGDIPTFFSLMQSNETFLKEVWAKGIFKPPSSLGRYAKMVKLLMKFLISFYTLYGNPGIGGSIDIYCIPYKGKIRKY